jgi:hypothetical protein
VGLGANLVRTCCETRGIGIGVEAIVARHRLQTGYWKDLIIDRTLLRIICLLDLPEIIIGAENRTWVTVQSSVLFPLVLKAVLAFQIKNCE